MCFCRYYKRQTSIKEIIDKERDISYQALGSEGDPEFKFIPGKNGILISAPHGAVHYRKNRSKEEDEYTAGIAQWLAEKTSSHVIYLRRRVDYDPNYDVICPYKQDLASLVQDHDIQFIIDVHGASDTRDFGIAIGTMHGLSCPDPLKMHIVESLTESGFSENSSGLDRLDVDNTFAGAGSDQTMTIIKFAHHKLGISAVQLELNAKLRIPERRLDSSVKKPFSGDPERITNALLALKRVIYVVEDFVIR